MLGRTSLLKATALALPFSLAAAAAHAADIAETVQQNEQLSRFGEAMTAAGLERQLGGEGPFPVFAPTNEAFEQLPKGALDELMKEENQAQLTKLVEHHVIQGEEIAADEVLGQQTRVETMSGDTLTVDGTSEAVLLVPTGLTIAQIGDQLVIEREGVAVSTHAIKVEDQVIRKAGDEQQQAQGSQPQVQGQQPQEALAAARTTTAEPSDMPMTEHQQEALKREPGQEQQQTAGAGSTDMPATEHQREVLSEGGEQGQQEQQTAARTTTAEPSGMPMTEHQQQALKSAPGQEQQQTAAAGSTDMPATEHQRQALAEEELPGKQEQAYEQAGVEGKPDILREASLVAAVQADNGVIHMIDAVLVPQSLLETLAGAEGQD
jgi:uncharacterized surface protein with fasciclin (FAS1) repeats